MSTPPLDPALLQAYRETLFEALDEHPLTLRIGEPNESLRQLHRRHDVTCSAFVTACNPRSESLPAEENDRRHADLRAELQHRGLTFFEGQGRHPSNSWPPERSLLVMGLELAAARELGGRWAQNAIVWSGADATPQLIVLDDDGDAAAPG
ncbi:MAG: DUF3293 domain-containing protein [Planctomycetota bacterium]